MNEEQRKQAAREREDLREELRTAVANLGKSGVYPAAHYQEGLRVGQLRRRGVRRPDPIRALTLIEDDNGVLLWETGMVLARSRSGLRRGTGSLVAQGEVVDHFVVEPLEPSKVGQRLTDLDNKLTPKQGLREWTANGLGEPRDDLNPASVDGKRILLVIHGTFSESQAIFDQWGANAAGKQFLQWAQERYGQILAFDHPTLSVSPMINALDLARLFRECSAPVDIICHSRGGLVARWFLEAFDPPGRLRRAVFVGAPLDGTSLASPPNLRRLMSWFSNLNKFVARGTALGSSLMPFLTVVSSLAGFTAAVASVAANTPALDAAIALIPGLAAMSRTSNNFEFHRLNRFAVRGDNYFVIKSKYVPKDPGWKFWQYFVDAPKERAIHSLFPGDNDLVVDTVSMPVVQTNDTPQGHDQVYVPAGNIFDFQGTSTVYHTNYFLQAQTSEQITGWLGAR